MKVLFHVLILIKYDIETELRRLVVSFVSDQIFRLLLGFICRKFLSIKYGSRLGWQVLLNFPLFCFQKQKPHCFLSIELVSELRTSTSV